MDDKLYINQGASALLHIFDHTWWPPSHSCLTCARFVYFNDVQACIYVNMIDSHVFMQGGWHVTTVYTGLYRIVSIHLFSNSCSAHQSEVLPVQET